MEVSKTFNAGMLEAEFWAPNMTFTEILHFFKTEDVTSESTKTKYKKLWKRTKQGKIAILKGKEISMDNITAEELKKATYWKYKGRDVEWVTSWHDELKFYVFDHAFEVENRTKEERYEYLKSMKDYFGPHIVLIEHKVPDTLEEVLNAYEEIINEGGEGVMWIKRNSLYKRGRITLNAAEAYKMKDSKRKYEGVITDVPESTVSIVGTLKSVNAFGRSKTSQLKEDREASGMAKGFDVVMDDGKILTVSFNGFNHDDRKFMLHHPEVYIGRRIMFYAMAPVRSDGVPRQAFAHRSECFLDGREG